MPLRGSNEWNGLRHLPPGFALSDGDPSVHGYALVTLSGPHSTHEPTRVGGGRALYATRIQSIVEWAAQYGFLLTVAHGSRPIITRGEYRVTLHERLPDQFSVTLALPTPAPANEELHAHEIPQDTPVPSVTNYTIDGTARLGTSFIPTDLIIAADAFNRPSSLPPYSYSPQAFTPYQIECEACGQEHPFGTVVCTFSNDIISCPACGDVGVIVRPGYGGAAWPINGLPQHQFTCSSCGATCAEEDCDRTVYRGLEFCDEHAEHSTCVNCGRNIEWIGAGDEPFPVGDRYACEECENYICVSCHHVSDYVTYSEEHSGNICAECRSNTLRRENETFDTDADLDFRTMPTIPGRESIRLCGIEIEGGNGLSTGRVLATDFYRAGLSSSDIIVPHQSGDRYGFVHVEADSTVDWETVIGPINMADRVHAEYLNNAVKLIRARVHSGDLKLDLRCGLHIHVSAERVGLAQAYNLSHLFTYIEDPFFRLAAAKWPFHRASQGSTHCAPIPKHTRKLAFYQNHGGAGRGRENHYYALSFMNYFNSMMRNCQCGAAGAGVWDECTCDSLGKCTFEFRLFNTTANPKKILAYIALCQALVAKAIDLPELKHPTEDFPLLEFNRLVLKEMEENQATALIEAWKPRIRYILNELPLTEEEKEAVMYCIRNSELAALGEGEIERLSMPEEVAV